MQYVMSCDHSQADLQTSSQRLNLSASNSAVGELKPESCIDDVIHHEVKEIGTHMWVFLLRDILLSWQNELHSLSPYFILTQIQNCHPGKCFLPLR